MLSLSLSSPLPASNSSIIKNVEIAVGTRKGKEGYGPDRRKADVIIKWQNTSGKTIKSTIFNISIRQYSAFLSDIKFCNFELKSDKLINKR